MFVLFSALPLDKICCIHFWKSLRFVSPCTQTVHNEPRLSFFFFFFGAFGTVFLFIQLLLESTGHSTRGLCFGMMTHFECVELVFVFLIFAFCTRWTCHSCTGEKKKKKLSVALVTVTAGSHIATLLIEKSKACKWLLPCWDKCENVNSKVHWREYRAFFLLLLLLAENYLFIQIFLHWTLFFCHFEFSLPHHLTFFFKIANSNF